MANGNAWYELVEGASDLMQGDLLFLCPIIIPAPELTFPIPSSSISAEVVLYDIAVVTQSCDLVNDKIESIIICAHWDLTTAGKSNPSLASRNTQIEIAKGKRARYMMLESSNAGTLSMGKRIVDFGQVFTLPKKYLKDFAFTQEKRLRMVSPYRERFAQNFAQFFGRVAVPQEVEP